MDILNSAGLTDSAQAHGSLREKPRKPSEACPPPANGASNLVEEQKIADVQTAAPASAKPATSSGARPPVNSAETVVLAQAQAGDHAAFAMLYSLHKRRVYSLCLRMLGNVAEAEDLTQEAFLQLHRKIATFRGDSAFSTWLHRLTINVVLMHLRRKGLNLISLDEAMDPSPENGPARSFGTPDLRLTGSIDRMTLERAVESLPAGYRLIFVLHDIEGYEHNEIATLLDCSIGNSKSQLHKARMKLREALRAPANEEMAK
jgi:RNA polymerase sigma-70 factor (ECF subfamily)